jgi:hypothetical protein
VTVGGEERAFSLEKEPIHLPYVPGSANATLNVKEADSSANAFHSVSLAPSAFGNGQSVLDAIAGDSPTATVIAYARVYLDYNVQFSSR